MNERLLEHAFSMARRPTPDSALELERLIREAQTPEEVVAQEELWRTSEYTRQAIKDRYQPEPYDLAELARLPADSLGDAYARHMIACNLSPAFYESIEATTDSLLVRKRIFETHDIMHVLLGYTTSVLDETGITGFYFGQQDRYHPPGGGVLMVHSVIQESAVFMHAALTDPEDARQQVRAFVTGYGRGYAARPFLSFRLEEMWDQPLTAVRARLALPERPDPGRQ
ncbi:MAG TPA: Coq4 family protein [Streptosporangiaceae bacterium]|nr:Coq4 family protein [Streptosporangiaceae bacterium]